MGGEGIDALALDVFEDQVGLAAGRDAGIGELRDVRVAQPREHRSFTHEPLLRGAADERRIQQLHRGPPFVAAVTAAREPYGAHAALAERGFQCVRADLHANRLPHLTQADKCGRSVAAQRRA